MRGHAVLFGRGFAIVALTAFQVKTISRGAYALAMVGSFGISMIWFGNSRHAAHSDLRFARETYAAGAAFGTLFGMWLGR